MDTVLAPNYANLFMDKFETKALDGCHHKSLTWKRFIDHMIWTHIEASLQEFIDYLNSLHKTIELPHELSAQSINFLDTTMKPHHNREIITTLFYKPTYTHWCLHYSSAQPYKLSWTQAPYGHYLRLRRICTLDTDFRDNAYKLTGYKPGSKASWE